MPLPGLGARRLEASIVSVLGALSLALLVLPGALQALGAEVMLIGLGYGGAALLLLGVAELGGPVPTVRRVFQVGTSWAAALNVLAGMVWAANG